jgi:hypothetical protein
MKVWNTRSLRAALSEPTDLSVTAAVTRRLPSGKPVRAVARGDDALCETKLLARYREAEAATRYRRRSRLQGTTPWNPTTFGKLL